MMKKKMRNHLNDLLQDHPFEICLSAALVLFGIRSLLSGLQSVPTSIRELPFSLIIIYCILSVVGGSSVLFGLIARYKYIWSYGVERAGLFISASAWLAYIVGFLFSPITLNTTLFMLALAGLFAGCLLRARALKRKSQATIVALRQAKANQEGS